MASLALSSALAISIMVMYVASASWQARSSPILSAHAGHDSIDEELGYSFGSHPYYSSGASSLEGRPFVNMEAMSRPQASNIGAAMTRRTLSSSSSSARVVTVDYFGAKADGKHDDTLAFEKAWKEACSANKGVVLLVPNKNYLIRPITFSGPCQSNIFVQIKGSIKATGDRSDYKAVGGRYWILFENVANLVVDGGGSGKIKGNGKVWWKNSCKVDKSLPCESAPTAMTFYGCDNLSVQNMKIQNAQQFHMLFANCNNVNVSHIRVTAPSDSPNTDGIHIAGTHNIHISSCVIGTGDDCISIGDGSQKVYATDITCGPGHGISIGSLGSNNSAAYVSEVKVIGAKLIGTMNGVRIKTWQGGSGSASHITFKDIEMQKVNNPIIIDQNYCDQPQPCQTKKSAVQVKDVVYKNITGTSATDVAIRFGCSKTVPCREITLQDISLGTANGAPVQASCDHVDITDIGNVSPRCPS